MHARFAACLLALVAIPVACGGRLISTETDGQSGASSSYGGSQASGATASTGATNNTGATGSYAASSSVGGGPSYAGTTTVYGGSVGIGGTGPIGCGPCPPIQCPTFGAQAVPNPDGCCYHCECNPMLCPGIACGSGFHLEMLAGECCASCVQDPNDCSKQQALYQDFKKQLVEKYSSYGCKTANDCTVYWDKNQCGAGCGVVMPTAAIPNLDTNLQSYAAQNCSPKCPFVVPPCEAPAGPFCFNGRCQ